RIQCADRFAHRGAREEVDGGPAAASIRAACRRIPVAVMAYDACVAVAGRPVWMVRAERIGSRQQAAERKLRIGRHTRPGSAVEIVQYHSQAAVGEPVADAPEAEWPLTGRVGGEGHAADRARSRLEAVVLALLFLGPGTDGCARRRDAVL